MKARTKRNIPTPEEAISLAKRSIMLKGEGKSMTEISKILGCCYHTYLKYQRMYKSGGSEKIRNYIAEVHNSIESQYEKRKKNKTKRDDHNQEHANAIMWDSILYSRRLSFNASQ